MEDYAWDKKVGKAKDVLSLQTARATLDKIKAGTKATIKSINQNQTKIDNQNKQFYDKLKQQNKHLYEQRREIATLSHRTRSE